MNAERKFKNQLIQELKANNLFDELVFQSIFISDETVKEVYNKKIKYYEILMQSYLSIITNNAIDNLKLDSF